MSMTKQKVAVLLEKFAAEYDIPLTFIENDEGDLVSDKKFIFNYAEKIGSSSHMIKISDDEATSYCLIEDDRELNVEILDQLCDILHSKYPCIFNFDDEYKLIWTWMPVLFSYFEDMPEEKKELYTLQFFRKSIKCGRILCNAYNFVVEDGMSVEQAINAAELEAEENGYKFTYNYDLVRDVVEERGPRYYVEHRYLPEDFYSDTEYYVNKFKEGDPNTAAFLLTLPIDFYNLPAVSEYNDATFEILVDADNLKCIHISIPNCCKEYDCPDIMLVISAKGNRYFTIEHGGVLPHKTNPAFFLGAWDDDCHSNYGMFKTRDEAMNKFMKLLDEYK